MTSELAPSTLSASSDDVRPRDRFGAGVLSLAVVVSVGSVLVLLVPGFPFAVVSPVADVAINTAATVAAGCVAGFAWIRYRDSGRNDALLQSSAFLTLFVAGLLRIVLQSTGHTLYAGFSVEAPGQAPIYSWTFARLVAAILLLAGAMATLNNWTLPRWRAGVILTSGPMLTLAYSLTVLTMERSLPVILPPDAVQRLVAARTVLDPGVLSPALVAIEVLIAAVFAVAALSYARVRIREGRDGYTSLLTIALIFAGLAQLQFAFVPSAYGDLVTSGDVLRLVFYLLMLAAVGSAIRADMRRLHAANTDLERLRMADAQRISAEERARLAREVHDGLVQDLWLARLTSGRVAEVPRLPREARDMLQRLDATLESAQGEARQALVTLQTRSDLPFGELLKRFVDDYADRFDVDIDRHVDTSISPRPETQSELLRVCREALNNVRKHADASRVRVALERHGDRLRLSIKDNGCGFDPGQRNGRGFGLESMRQRAEKIGGRLSVTSEPMNGTTVELELPLENANAGAS